MNHYKIWKFIKYSSITFGDIEIENCKFHNSKDPINISNIGIEKIIISNKIFFGEKDLKYFLGYKDDEKI